MLTTIMTIQNGTPVTGRGFNTNNFNNNNFIIVILKTIYISNGFYGEKQLQISQNTDGHDHDNDHDNLQRITCHHEVR